MENKIDTANAKFDNWITQKLKFFIICLSPVNIALCRIYYCEKYTIIIIIVKRLGLELGTWDLGPGTWDLGPRT